MPQDSIDEFEAIGCVTTLCAVGVIRAEQIGHPQPSCFCQGISRCSFAFHHIKPSPSPAMSNQAWQITAPGSISLVTLPSIPSPGPNQALIRIQAVSLNYRDVLVVDHSPSYPVEAKPNLTPCSDGAGVIEQTGPGSKWKKGDRVFVHPNTWKTGPEPRAFDLTLTMGGGSTDGTLRRYVVLDDDRIVKAPDNLSIEEVATLYTAGATAWNSLFHGKLKLEAGMSILTQGTGGVSVFAIQVS